MVNIEVVSRIAQKIRAIRLKKNLTIQQLADRTNVTKGLLSKIENSRTIPSLPVFVQLIQSLDISLKDFFEDMVPDNGKNYLLIRKDHYTSVARDGRQGFNYHYIVSQNITSSVMEVVLLTLEPGANEQPTTSDGYEFNYILSGNCEYHINNDILALEEGDSLYFDASIPHLPINRSKKKVLMLVICFIVPGS